MGVGRLEGTGRPVEAQRFVKRRTHSIRKEDRCRFAAGPRQNRGFSDSVESTEDLLASAYRLRCVLEQSTPNPPMIGTGDPGTKQRV